MKTISVILGTRPEAIKLAPVVSALRGEDGVRVHVCSTGQHREMLDQVLDLFDIRPDVDLRLMRPDQRLAALTARAVAALDRYLEAHRPDLVLVQGDTTTVLAAALAACYRQTPVGHVEAGLRTGDRHAPFPEETNRVLTTHLADLHFAPTEGARAHLLREGIAEGRIFVTGNTVVDALQRIARRVRSAPPVIAGLPHRLMAPGSATPLVLVTGHRRENFGSGFRSICTAIRTLAGRFRDAAFVYPVHLNPNVREPVFALLSGERNVYLIEPQGYLHFVALMDRAAVILTDSGGVQEEAPSLGKPVLVMRETTERPEAIAAGLARLVGTDVERIVDETARLLLDPEARARVASVANPFGDGRAAERIAGICAGFLRGAAPAFAGG